MWYALSLRSLGCVVWVVNLRGSQQGVLWLYLSTGSWVLWFDIGAGTGFRVWENGKDLIEERQGWKSLSVTTWTIGGERKTEKEWNERNDCGGGTTTKSFHLTCMYVHVLI